jgi:hypothetical protein
MRVVDSDISFRNFCSCPLLVATLNRAIMHSNRESASVSALTQVCKHHCYHLNLLAFCSATGQITIFSSSLEIRQCLPQVLCPTSWQAFFYA